jgi:dTDP-4-dehydrorhamnose reductase
MADYPYVVKRPVNCILENRLLKKQSLNLMPEWEKDIKAYLSKFGSELVKRAKAKSL